MKIGFGMSFARSHGVLFLRFACGRFALRFGHVFGERGGFIFGQVWMRIFLSTERGP